MSTLQTIPGTQNESALERDLTRLRCVGKDFRPVLELALSQAIEYVSRLDEQPVGATSSLADLRARLCKPWNRDGMEACEVITELARDTAGGLNNSMNARFYAWVIGGSLPSALAADWLTSTWDQNAGMYAVSPAAAVVEEAVGGWLKDLFGLPQQTSFALVTGCQMAHATCLAAARSWLLKKQGWDVERQGMAGSPADRAVWLSPRDNRSYLAPVRSWGRVAENTNDKPIRNTR